MGVPRPSESGESQTPARLRGRDYEKEKSPASEALGRKKYATAHQSLASAPQLRPDAPEVREFDKKVQAASQLDDLESIRGDAAQHEKAEHWDLALNAYEKALSIDKNATFALRGKDRSEQFLKLKQQLDFYLMNPDRLQSPEPLAHARKLLGVANAIPNIGASLRESHERLQILVDRLSSPRPVILRSDEATQVTVLLVGRFGQLRERRLTLPPGQYTALGSRAGYRDVRVHFRVLPDDKETVVDIRCEERI